MYTTPLSTLISSLSLNHHLYADDTQLFNGSIARSASCRYLIYSEADFEFFCPAGVKFGMEEGTKGPLLHAKFHPHLFNDKGVGSQKLKFLLRFDQNVAYKCPAGACPLRDFHKIRRVCISFQDALGVKILLDLLKGLWSYGSFKLRGSGYPEISQTAASWRHH